MTDFEFAKIKSSLPAGTFHIGALRLMMCHCIGREVSMDECNAAMEKIWDQEKMIQKEGKIFRRKS